MRHTVIILAPGLSGHRVTTTTAAQRSVLQGTHNVVRGMLGAWREGRQQARVADRPTGKSIQKTKPHPPKGAVSPLLRMSACLQARPGTPARRLGVGGAGFLLCGGGEEEEGEERGRR